MSVIIYLLPLALVIGGLWVAIFLWCLRSNQFDDMQGAARRILDED